MNYNKKQIFNMFKQIPLYKGMDFHEEKNEEVIFGLKNFKDDFFYSYGATKLVLIPKDTEKDFVIKIPYTGFYRTEYNEDCQECKIYHKNNSANKQRPWDYCLTEVMRYRAAISNGLGRCFARTEFLGSINGYPIYVQEKCAVLSKVGNKTHTKKAQKLTLNQCGDPLFDAFIDINWLTDFRLYYGNKVLQHFTQFILDHGWEDDLRPANIGYIDNRPVLVDYASFLE